MDRDGCSSRSKNDSKLVNESIGVTEREDSARRRVIYVVSAKGIADSGKLR